MTITIPYLPEKATYPVLVALFAVFVTVCVMPLFQNKFNPKGKYCYITGASTGLGLAVSTHLLSQGADICIVSKNPSRLSQAEETLRALAKPGQKVYAISADLTDAEDSQRALDEAITAGGRVPDVAFLCAGASYPRYFVETTTEQLKEGLDSTYWIQAWSAHALCKKMVSNRIKGKIVLVGSFLGYSSFVGYTNYAPGKYALRGLADSLRSEMLLHDISVHLFMPAGINSPGYETEQKYKPTPTKKLEEGDQVLSPEDVARHLFRGLDKGYYQSTTYPITELMRMATKGGVPGNNPFMDLVYWLGSGIGMPIWVMAMDWITKGFKKEVEKDFEAKGMYVVPKKD